MHSVNDITCRRYNINNNIELRRDHSKTYTDTKVPKYKNTLALLFAYIYIIVRFGTIIAAILN